MSNIRYNFVKFISHLVPEGSPNFLIPLLVLIELIRKMIRSLTLCLRLTIKMMTGHIFITLTGIGFMVILLSGSFNPLTTTFLLVFQTGYIFFEVFVRLLQGFVFSLLLLQYCKEHRKN